MSSSDGEKLNYVVSETAAIGTSASADKHVLHTNGFDAAEDFEQSYGATKRGLNCRVINILSVASSIGSGLFIGISSPLVSGGSLSLFLGFVFYSCFVMYPLMQCVTEMCSYLPIRGSIFHFGARFIDPAAGFAAGWVYYYAATMFVCVELTAMAGVISYWDPDTNSGAWIALGLFSGFFVMLMPNRVYGEVEFYSSIMKVLLIIGLMIFAFISMCGGNPNHDAYGFQHWKEGGLFKEYLASGSTGKFLGFWNVMIYAAFACGGPDLISMIAGETMEPRRLIPICGKRSFARIYIFYIGGVFFLNTLCSSINSELLAAIDGGSSGAAASPWVLGIEAVGVKGISSLVNVVVMFSCYSCFLGFSFTASRTIYSLALADYAPRIFMKCLPNGSPYVATTSVTLIGCLSFLSVSNSTAVVFDWFVNLATTGILCTYFFMFLCYFKFRAAFKAQGHAPEELYYTAPWGAQPYISYFGMFMVSVIIFFNGFWIFFPGEFSVANLFTSYFAPVFTAGIYLFWKVFKRTKHWSSLEADITSDKAEIDAEDAEFEQWTRDHPPKEFKNPVMKFGIKVFDFFFG